MRDKDFNNTSRSDWATIDAMSHQEIDYSDIPPLTDEFFENATLRIPAINLDEDTSNFCAEPNFLALRYQN